MRKLLRFLFRKPVLWASRKFDSKPDQQRVFDALTKLFNRIIEKQKKGIIVHAQQYGNKFIIFSDQHKGARNGADDFNAAADNYVNALNHYYEEGFCFINLGDGEELWENTLGKVKRYNKAAFTAEAKFANSGRLMKIFGNHDLYWEGDPLAPMELEKIYGCQLPVYEGVIIMTGESSRPVRIFCTHGHQGDAYNDGNRLVKFFIARIWAPFQAYLSINTNEPSNNEYKKTLHNEIMYQWSAQQEHLILITGHTHQPVFESLTHIERVYYNMR